LTRSDEQQLRIGLAALLRRAARFGWTEDAARGGRVERFVKALTGMVFVGLGIRFATLRA